MVEYTLQGMVGQTHSEVSQRLALLLWGSAGSGKTTLAATAPGKKVWLNFDPDGPASVLGNRDDIIVFDFSVREDAVVQRFKEPDPFGIDRFLADHPEVETVVVDSVTMFGDKALTHGVREAKTSIEEPEFKGYGRKNTWTRLMIMNLLRITGKHNRHIVFVCHEDVPTKNSKGDVLFITIMLGSSLSEEAPLQISEVWSIQQLDDGTRRIAVRPVRMRKPMKTRMFLTSGPAEFLWRYNADTQTGPGLADWFQAWKENGFAKIDLPK